MAAILGTCTALFAATTAITQNDIKRVIAYSTCSQFGYLFASVGLSQSSSTVLHLSSHAGFKALLFICAGGVIHSMKDQQDMRRLGGLITILPFTYASMLIASLSLMALPYLSGNVSKDLILELAAVHISIPGTFMWILGSVVAGITACYSIRLLGLTFFGEPSADKSSYHSIHEQSLGLIVPMLTLSLTAIFFGYLAKEPLSGMGVDSITSVSSNKLSFSQLVEAEFGLNVLPKNLPVIFTILGTILGIVIFIPRSFTMYSITKIPIPSFIYKASSNKWWIDGLFARSISWPLLDVALFGSKTVDRGLFELFGAWGIAYRASTPTYTTKESLLIPETRQLSSINRSMLASQYTSNNVRNLSEQNIFSNNVGEYALYVGGIAILVTFASIFNILQGSEAYLFSIIILLLYTLFR